jgi:hypothetical protein
MAPPKTPPLIFINTDNGNSQDKLYQAAKAGGAKAEEIIQTTIKKIVEKAAGFTTNKSDDAKGYTIRLTVSEVAASGPNVKCSMSGSIEFYPPVATMKRGKGTEMLSTGMTGHASASGSTAVLDCVEAIAEDLTKKAIPIMKANFADRYGGGK